MTNEFRHRKACPNIPPALRDGAQLAALPIEWIATKDERAIIIEFICQRRLFGFSYLMLQPQYFASMPPGSGMLLGPLLRTSEIFTGVNKPGDIDLAIPYEGNELVLDQIMAFEFKTIRASFDRQHKSPNDFGFTQADALLAIGIPYVTVAHAIVSNGGPPESWREISVGKVLDNDRIEALSPIKADMLPSDLMARAIGRLRANAPNETLGLLASYIEISDLDQESSRRRGTWLPDARRAQLNESFSTDALDAIAEYVKRRPYHFVNTPRHDP